MRLIDCLSQLPAEMKLIDLSATGTKISTVAEIIDNLSEYHRNEEGFEIRERKTNYGKTTVTSIGVIGGPNMYNEASY